MELLQPVEPRTYYLCIIIIDVILHYIIHALYKWFLCISIFCTTDEGSWIAAETFGFIFLLIGEECYVKYWPLAPPCYNILYM